jgi:hypothetical protein
MRYVKMAQRRLSKNFHFIMSKYKTCIKEDFFRILSITHHSVFSLDINCVFKFKSYNKS